MSVACRYVWGALSHDEIRSLTLKQHFDYGRYASKNIDLTAAWRSTVQQLNVLILLLSDNKIRLKLKELCHKIYQILNSEGKDG